MGRREAVLSGALRQADAVAGASYLGRQMGLPERAEPEEPKAGIPLEQQDKMGVCGQASRINIT